jgi:hypothetical protein
LTQESSTKEVVLPKLIILDRNGHTTVPEEEAKEEFEKQIGHHLAYVKEGGRYRQVHDFPESAEEVFLTPPYAGG